MIKTDYSALCDTAIQRPPGAFDGMRIHTNDIDEAITDIAPGTLTLAVLMDSMDWFDPQAKTANTQIRKLTRALKMGGLILLRSSALRPWYLDEFELLGFKPESQGQRAPFSCIDRVNMYTSCWLCTKLSDLPQSMA
ncbi:hypothetical protein BX600DRAFT_444256 [Xylariales sp. PMI_506]|nr:hypothetical protein BX600DRAFT_444256 [Xylariales sp. PMI_506]